MTEWGDAKEMAVLMTRKKRIHQAHLKEAGQDESSRVDESPSPNPSPADRGGLITLLHCTLLMVLKKTKRAGQGEWDG